MSEENNNPKRLNQWFIRGIGIIVAGLFVLIMIFTLLDLDLALFSQDLTPILEFDYVLIAKQIGKTLWTFRVYDLLLVVILVMLGSISSYYLVSYKTEVKSKLQQQRRYRF